MANFMKPFAEETYAVLRIITGLLFFVHGSSKILGIPVPPPPDAPILIIWVAGGIELVGGGFVAAGFMTRWAAFICSGLMAAAYWMAHGLKAVFPIENGGELAVVYCFLFLFIAARGPGKWSVDATG